MVSSEELKDSELIREKNPKSVWIFLILFLLFFDPSLGPREMAAGARFKKQKEAPFFKVTNREFSLFVLQNPEFAKENLELKNYLSFLPQRQESTSLYIKTADQFVSLPPWLIFRYHIWNLWIRGVSLAPRPIESEEFLEFLQQNPEWQPKNWKRAPRNYQRLVEELEVERTKNLQKLSFQELPFNVRLAFQGWKNYFKEWKKIENLELTEQQMTQFLKKNRTYGRSYWRNILMKQRPKYLISYKNGAFPESSKVLPQEELSNFLKIAFYNFYIIQQNKIHPDK